MPKLICILCLFVFLSGCQQTPSVPPVSTTTQETALTERYTLYKTDNHYTFIKLDTQTGQLWQVHWHTEEGRDGIDVLSSEILANTTKRGRFRLFSTFNMYNFILLDEVDGRIWQVQWSFDEKKRGIWRIE